MTRSLETRLLDAAGDVLREPLREAAAPFLALRGDDACSARVDGQALVGLARALSVQPETARFLSHRPAFLERIAELDRGSLAAREGQLSDDAAAITALDLEQALDALRLRRREEMAFAACVDLAGLAPFEAISDFLSVLAETTTEIAITLAERSLSGASAEDFSVIGMGKIAGREFTYHSDLDLIFLYRGGPEQVAAAARIAQRLIAYLTTMTGAGTAYAVDTRLRPSGQQGMLVVSYDAFERYQSEEAQTWEHLALLRARPIAGETAEAGELLDRVRARILSAGEKPWIYLSDLRRRVEAERASSSPDTISLKTGAGGLMDVDFLAGGGLLERSARRFPPLPGVAAMLRACASGPRIEGLLDDYRLLRLVEARARWIAGRGIEAVDANVLPLVAELVEPGLDAHALRDRLVDGRARIRAAWDDVVAADSLRALE
jgi:glutamine synthetase adenylyltransferase